MKLVDGGPRGTGEDRGGNAKRNSTADSKLAPLPAEWMDPLSWRLPSGKALAEFALRSGFLAPLMLGSPMGSLRVKPTERGARKAPAEVPASTGRFREAGTAGKRA